MSNDISLDVPDLRVSIDKPGQYHVILQDNVHRTIIQNVTPAPKTIIQPAEHYHIIMQHGDNRVVIQNPDEYTVKIISPRTVPVGALTGRCCFPYTGSAHITGSLHITGSFEVGTALCSVLYVDEINGRVGINTRTPQYSLHVSGAIFASDDITAFSDRRWKTDIVPIYDALGKVARMSGVTFRRIDGDDRRHMGFIAQDVQKVVPEVVVGTHKNGFGVSYGNITALLVEAIKELKVEVDELKQLRG
jgi:hypothetical protein